MFRNAATVASVLLLASLASADVIVVDLVDGSNDSGWSVVMPDDTGNGIIVDDVSSSSVRIEIAKTFTEFLPGSGFVPRTYVFRQRLPDADTASTIEITDEVIRNLTGLDWEDYHWEIVGRTAAFDKVATDASGFSIDPFTNKAWGPLPPGWGAGHSSRLNVDGGVVPDGGTFTPGLAAGKLYIDVDLGPGNSDFALVQVPTPEPGAIALILIGAGFALKRRLRRRG